MAQPIAYYEDGTPIPQEEWDQAVQSGQALWEAGQQIRALSPTGERVTLPAEEYGRAIQSGYRIATPEEVARYEREKQYGGVGEGAKALVEGVGRGLTFGLSDQIGAAISDDYAEAAAARREVNPTAAGAGEILGAVAPIIATGGTGAAARGVASAGALPRGVAQAGRSAGALAERLATRQGGGALNRIVAKGVGGAAEAAVEGGFYGVGQAITDNALHDAELSAEKLISAYGEGALFAGLLGGAFGGSIGAVGVGMGKARELALNRLGAESTQEALRGFAERRAFKQVVGNYKKPVQEAARRGDDALQRMGRKLLDEGAPTRKLSEFIPWVERRTRRAGEELDAIARQLDDAGVKLDGRSLLRRIDSVIDSYRKKSTGDHKKVARALAAKIRPLRDKLDPPTPKKKGKPRIEIDPIMGARVVDDTPVAPPPVELSFGEFWRVRQDLDDTIKWGKRGGDISTDGMLQLRDAFRAELDDMVSAGGQADDLLAKWKRSSQDYGDFALLEKHAKEYSEARKSNRDVSLTDYLAAIGGATSIAAGNVGGVLSAGATTLANKAAREQGNWWLSTMADRLSKFEGRFELATQAIAGIRKASEIPKKAIAPVTVSVMDKYERAREQVNALRDPRTAVAVLAQASEGLGDRPDIVHALHQRLLGDAQYLSDSLPQPLTRAGASLTPKAEAIRLPPSAVKKFVSKADALADPLSVAEDIARGKLDRDAIEALKARRPKIYEALRNQVMIYTAQRGEALPYKQRILLSLAFDFTGDRSLEPQTLAAIQGTWAAKDAEQSQPGQAGMPGSQAVARMGQKAQEQSLLPSQRVG